MMTSEHKKILYAALLPCLFVLLLWTIHLLEQGLGADWHRWGLYPRSWEGLKGILAEPLLHSDVKHLVSNSIPLFILGWCLFYFYKDMSFRVVTSIWLLSGMITWLIGRESWHIGASGIVYGLSFFLFLSGILRRYIPLMAISLLVVFLYGSTLWNMFPIAEIVDPSTSWEGHLAGAISGLVTAFFFRRQGPQKPEEESLEDDEDDDFTDEWKEGEPQ